MRASRYLIPGLLLIALLVTSVGWYRAANPGSDQHFDSCNFDDGTLTLTYSYGANQVVSPSVDATGPDIVVALHIEVGEGPTPAIGLHGEASFIIFGGPSKVRYPDGEGLDCSPA